jgi:hypothetical protein
MGYGVKHLWEQFLSGSDPAFKNRMDRYFPLLYRYGRKFTQNNDLVKDRIQDLFIQLHQKRTSPPRSAPSAYLLRSIRNLIFNALTSGSRFSERTPGEDKDFPIEFSVEDAMVQQQLSRGQAGNGARASVAEGCPCAPKDAQPAGIDRTGWSRASFLRTTTGIRTCLSPTGISVILPTWIS